MISDKGFDIRVYLNDGEFNSDQHFLHEGMKRENDYWITEKSIKNRDDAINLIIKLIKLIELQPDCSPTP